MTDKFTSCDDCDRGRNAYGICFMNCVRRENITDCFTPKKPRTIMIGDVEVVAGIRWGDEIPDVVYVSKLYGKRYVPLTSISVAGENAITLGVAHGTPENAIAMSKAMLKQLEKQ